MAAGNFKRQAGDIHLPVDLSAPAAGGAASGLILPGCGDRIERGTPGSWRLLGQIPGLGGIPTASCVLAALWPDCHVIMDVRDRRAAVGLHVGRRLADDRRLSTLRIPSGQWWFYDWFRRSVTATAKAASVSPVEVERALFVLDARVGNHLPDGWTRTGTWATYHARALEQVSREAE